MSSVFDEAARIYLEVRAFDAAERDQAIDAECQDNPDLRAHVLELLQGDESVGSVDELIDEVVTVRDAILPDQTRTWGGVVDDARDPVDENIGPYRLLERIGEGGFGMVYIAEQTAPVRRRVAIKVLKAGMDTKRVVARFEAERQALALMDHPAIARVLDAGTTPSGRPFFAMEFVPGAPITEHCRKACLSVNDRIRLFLRVCDGVRHAHQRGIIHRDLKPSNILVRTDTDPAMPKVIDFGIAKALSSRLGDSTVYTEQRQLLGTPDYMSPEQASGSPHDIDTRSDVYSLGAVLYEMLAGVTPFANRELRGLSFAELERVLNEEDPQRPSLAARDTNRTDTTLSSSAIRGELDWIVLRALERSRDRRYASVDDLADDLRRFLSGQAVSAAPPSMGYRAKKFLRRHRAAAVVTGGLLFAGVIGVGSTLYALFETRRLLERAEGAEADATIAAEFAENRAAELERLAYRGLIETAEEAIRFGHRDRAIGALESCPPTLRGPEWQWTFNRLHTKHATLDHMNDAPTRGARFLPDGRRVATVSNDGSGRIWDAATGRGLARFDGHGSFVLAVDVSPDGTLAASTGGVGHKLWLWSTSTGDEVASSRGHVSWVTGVAFSPDGTRIATCSSDTTLRVWDAQTLEELHELTVHTGGVFGIAWHPDGTQLASVGNDGRLVIWSAETWRPVHELQLNSSGADAVTYTPDGSRVITGDDDNRLTWWDPATGERVRSVPTAGRSIIAICMSPDGELLAASDAEGTISVHDAATGSPRAMVLTTPGTVHDIAFDPSGDRLVAAHADGKCRIYDVVDLAGPLDFVSHDSHVVGLAGSPDGERVYSIDAQGVLCAWDPNSGRRLWTEYARPSKTRLSVLPEVGGVALLSDDRTIEWFAGESGERLGRLELSHPVLGFRACPTADLIVTISVQQPHTVECWDLTRQDRIFSYTLDDTSELSAGAYLDATTCLVGTEDGRIIVWDIGETPPERSVVYEGDSPVRIVTATADGRVVYAGLDDGSLLRLDRSGERPVARAFAHPSPIITIEVMEDVGRVATCGASGRAIRLWELDPTDPIGEIDPQMDDIQAVSFADGALFVGGANGVLRRIGETSRSPSYSTIASIKREQQQARLDLRTARDRTVEVLRLAAQHRMDGENEIAVRLLEGVLAEAASALPPNHPSMKYIGHHLDWSRVARDTDRVLALDEMRRYVGDYQERHLSIVNGKLTYSHDWYENSHALIPLVDGTYALEDVDEFRIRLELDASGRATVLHGLYLNGYSDESPRSDAPAIQGP